MNIYLTLPPYLAQWLRHQSGGETPIRLKRGSVESDLLQYYLKPQPKTPGYVPQIRPLEGQVAIQIPCFKHKDIETYNYLPPNATILLQEIIRCRFVIQLWKDLITIDNVPLRNDILISQWMEAHGIEDDDRNWNAIAKILQRKRACYNAAHRLTDRKSSKHRKK